LNSWKATSTRVAWARFAASPRAPLTTSRLVMASESQSNNSRSRCRPSAFNPASLLWAIQPSTAPLCDAASCFASRSDGEKILRHRQNLFHCRFLTPPLQEKNAPPSTFPPPDRARDRRSSHSLASVLHGRGRVETRPSQTSPFALCPDTVTTGSGR